MEHFHLDLLYFSESLLEKSAKSCCTQVIETQISFEGFNSSEKQFNQLYNPSMADQVLCFPYTLHLQIHHSLPLGHQLAASKC